MPLPVILLSDSGVWLQLIAGLALAIVSALGYNRHSPRRILDDPDVTKGLTPEQRLRLELGLLETTPGQHPDRPAAALLPADRQAILQAVREAREDSRRRERADLQELSPGELARLRQRMERVLRERWARIEARFNELRADHSPAAWGPLLNGELGLLALLTDLALELHAAKGQATYPPVVLQLEGPLGTLASVVRHAQQSLDPATPPTDAHSLRSGVLAFLADVFPGICQNIRETESPTDLGEEYELADEVEIRNQDLPTL
jgi:hypothetical protein